MGRRTPVSDEGFREFVEASYSELLRTAYLLTGSADAAEDLLQTTLLKVMRRFGTLDEPFAYVRRTMVNQRISMWRRLGRHEVLTAVLPERRQPDQTSAVDSRDELLQALAKLPVRMRTVLVLRYWEDVSEIETAELMGCSVGSVKSQASRGLARLRTVMNPPPVPRTVEVIA